MNQEDLVFLRARRPTLKQEWLQMAFSRWLFHFQAVFHLPSWSSVSGWLQLRYDHTAETFYFRHLRTRASILAAADGLFNVGTLFTLRRSNLSRGACFCGLTSDSPYLLLCLICVNGCSVRRCCCLEPHESWTQRGSSSLCRVRFRGPPSI